MPGDKTEFLTTEIPRNISKCTLKKCINTKNKRTRDFSGVFSFTIKGFFSFFCLHIININE